MEERRLKAQEDEIKGNHALLTGELMMRVCGRMHCELDLLHEIMTKCADVLLKDPTNEFAKLQHEKFQLKFESKMSELEKSAAQSAIKISGGKWSLLLNLTAESDSDDNNNAKIFTPPKTIPPK